jgi:hypothetical protein
LNRKGEELQEKFFISLLLKIFQRWQLITSRVVNAVARRKERKRDLLNAFTAWKDLVKRCRLGKKYQLEQESRRAKRLLDYWRLKLHEQLCSAEVDKLPRIQMLRTAMQHWKRFIAKRHNCLMFQQSVNQHTIQLCFARWKTKWLIINQTAVNQEDNKARDYKLMSKYLRLWQQQAQKLQIECNRMGDLATGIYTQHTLQHCYQVWCQRLKALKYCSAAVQRRNHQVLRLVFMEWHHHTQHQLNLAIHLFQLSLSNSCIIRKESLFDDENLEVSSDTNTLIEADTKENIARRFIGRLTLGCRTVDIFIAWRHLCCSRADLRRKFKAFQFEQCKRWKQESFSRWQKESLLYHAASNCCTFQLLQKVFKYWVIYSSMAKQKKFYFITANHIRSQRMLTTYLCAWKGKYASRTLMRTVLQSWRAWASQEAMVQRGLREYQERVNRSAALSAFFRWIQACRMTLRVSAFRSHLLVKFFKKWKRASILVKSLRQRANAHIAKVARKKVSITPWEVCKSDLATTE